MGRVEFFDSHFQRASEQFCSLIEVAPLLTEYSLSEVDDPVDWVVVAEAGKYFNSFGDIISSGAELVEKHQVLGKVAVANSIMDIVLTHLFFS